MEKPLFGSVTILQRTGARTRQIAIEPELVDRVLSATLSGYRTAHDTGAPPAVAPRRRVRTSAERARSS
jgi:hypothetical protein